MNKNKLKEMIREIVDRVLNENAPAKPKEKETKEAPTKPDTEKERGPRRGFEQKPGVKPNPKAKHLKEEDIVKKITDRFKKLKK